MLQSVFDFLQSFFGNIWLLFSSWYIPGTRITPAAFFMLFLVIYLVVFTLRRFFGQND